MTEFAALQSPELIESGDPALDRRAFRRCLGQYATGVSVITAKNGTNLVGMAVNSFAAVSLDPPLVLWSIRRESRSAPDFLEASHFAVNVLAANQVQVSQWFGSAHPDRFALAAWSPGQCGAPLLAGTIAHLECRRVQVHEGGDHWILIGQVERYARYKGEPLLFAQGQYAVVRNHPHLVAGTPSAPAGACAAKRESSFLKQLSMASERMSSMFQEHRQALGLNPASTRILSRLYEGPCTVEELERVTYLGREAIEDTLCELERKALVLKRDQAYALSDAGRAASDAVAARSAQFSVERLAGIADEDVAAARRVLLVLGSR